MATAIFHERIIYVGLLLYVLCTVGGDVCTEQTCECTETSLICRQEADLTRVPLIGDRQHRERITYISIEDQVNLLQLNDTSFSPYPNLQRIVIRGSGLRYINESTFTRTPEIRKIELANNDIRRLTWRTVRNLKFLHSLNLVNNSLPCDCYVLWLQELVSEPRSILNDTWQRMKCVPEHGDRPWLSDANLTHCEKPVVHIERNPVLTTANESTRVTCSSSNGASTRWLVANLTSTFTVNTDPTNGDSELVIQKASPADNGYIWCLGSNQFASTRKPTRFIIEGPPIMVQKPRRVYETSGHCMIYYFRGVPWPNVTWSREKHRFRNIEDVIENKVFPVDRDGDADNPSIAGLYEGCLKPKVRGRPDMSGYYNITLVNRYGSVTERVWSDFGNVTFPTFVTSTPTFFRKHPPIQTPWNRQPPRLPISDRLHESTLPSEPLLNQESEEELSSSQQNITVTVPIDHSTGNHWLVIYLVIPLVLAVLMVVVVLTIVGRRGPARNRRLYTWMGVCGGFRKEQDDAEVQKHKLVPIRSQRMLQNPNYHKKLGEKNSDRMMVSTGPVNIARERISLMRTLGEGAFGKVYLGMLQGVGEARADFSLVAIKTIKDTSGCERMFEQEVELMIMLQHEHIVKFIGISVSDEPQMMLFEYMENGDLNNFLRSHGPDAEVLTNEQTSDIDVDENALLKLSEQIASGVRYLASQHFVHRDLATRNCLVGPVTSCEGGLDLIVKIGDFGMSRDIYSTDYYKINTHTMLPVRWMAPESILYRKFTVESDIWSLGVVLWEIYSYGHQPWSHLSNHEVVLGVQEGDVLPRPATCPEPLYKVMVACWRKAPTERISINELHDQLERLSQPSHTYLDLTED